MDMKTWGITYFEQVETHLRDGKSLLFLKKMLERFWVYECQNARFFRNPRVAKYFAEKHNYEYIGFVEGHVHY